MNLLANDLSIHEQFRDISSFREAFAKLMMMRDVARRLGSDVQCHRGFGDLQPLPGVPMRTVLHRFSKSERLSAMLWLTKGGSFWDDLRRHSSDDYLECRGRIVTDTSIGEAAYRALHGIECGLVSVTPSKWEFSPIEVVWHRDSDSDDEAATLENWCDAPALERGLGRTPNPVRSWREIQNVSTSRFDRLTIAGDCFEPLAGIPFSRSAAERFLALLSILDRFARAFDSSGRRTVEGQRIYQDYFTGDRAWFSDSSDREKHAFQSKLTFPRPGRDKEGIFCTWHGKVSHMTLRLHFSWPVQSGKPVYVVYAGPKITKQ